MFNLKYMLVLLSVCTSLSLSCTCAPRDFREEYCGDLAAYPVVAVRIMKDISPAAPRARRPQRTSWIHQRSRRDSLQKNTDHPSSTSPPSPPSPTRTTPTGYHYSRSSTVRVAAEIVHVYRGPHTYIGNVVLLDSETDGGMCGIGETLQRIGQEFIMPLVRYPDSFKQSVYMCDFFLNRRYHYKVGNVDTYFKNIECDKAAYPAKVTSSAATSTSSSTSLLKY